MILLDAQLVEKLEKNKKELTNDKKESEPFLEFTFFFGLTIHFFGLDYTLIW